MKKSAAAIRLAALFLLLAAIVYAAALWRAETIARSFAERSAAHLKDDAALIRGQIAQLEKELDASATRIAANISSENRPRLFEQLAAEVRLKHGRGARIIDSEGEAIAWWGEDYRAPADRTYQFDVTNLYITRVRKAKNVTVEVFERIENVPGRHGKFHHRDAWVQATIFHASFPKLEKGSQRFFIAKQNESALYVDVTPRPKDDVVAAKRAEGVSAAAVLLALGAMAVMSAASSRWLSILLVLLARVALLPVRFPNDSYGIFGFDVYASKILGPFSKSPFDLLLTAAALLAILILLRPLAVRPPWWGRAILAALAAWGFVRLVGNFVANSRVSALPDHIIPSTPVQAVLFGALLLFGFCVVAFIVRIIDLTRWSMLVRMIVVVLAVTAVVFIPQQVFSRETARNFISDVYAPLVAGEAGQLRTMITSTLQEEFTRIDLTTILPDDYRHMSLEDLAYALWLRSNLSKWHVPAVISISDEFTRSAISRFGVGLPQFDETASSASGEILQVGRIRRVLMHHDFDVIVFGTTIGLGSVHVVNPGDPGATAYSDIYREFFDTSSDDRTGLHPQREPAVYDREGNAQSAMTYRLPQKPSVYFARLKPGQGLWVTSSDPDASALYVRRAENALYVFPLQIPTVAQQIRRAGGVAICALIVAVLLLAWRSLPRLLELARMPRTLDFRARTSIYLTAVVIVPLIAFVLFVRAYLANRLETEYVERGQTALNAAQRVIEDYIGSQSAAPEQVLDDEIFSWLARVIGHDLHLYRGEGLDGVEPPRSLRRARRVRAPARRRISRHRPARQTDRAGAAHRRQRAIRRDLQSDQPRHGPQLHARAAVHRAGAPDRGAGERPRHDDLHAPRLHRPRRDRGRVPRGRRRDEASAGTRRRRARRRPRPVRRPCRCPRRSRPRPPRHDIYGHGPIDPQTTGRAAPRARPPADAAREHHRRRGRARPRDASRRDEPDGPPSLRTRQCGDRCPQRSRCR